MSWGGLTDIEGKAEKGTVAWQALPDELKAEYKKEIIKQSKAGGCK